MRVIQRIGIWAATCGLMLALGNAALGQTNSTSTGNGGSNGGSGTSSGIGANMPGMQGPGSGGGHGGMSPNTQISAPSSTDSDISLSPQTEAEQAKLRNAERQKQLVTDTQKLVSLANELKSDVDKSNKDMLSLDVVRKADEIEKLAHSVKERMKCSGCSGISTSNP